METPNAAAESFVKPELFESTLHGIAIVFEAAGVAVMVLGLLLATVQGLRQTAKGTKLSETYHPFRNLSCLVRFRNGYVGLSRLFKPL